MSLEAKMTKGDEKPEPEALKACVRVRPFVQAEKSRALRKSDLVPCLEKNDRTLSVVDRKPEGVNNHGGHGSHGSHSSSSAGSPMTPMTPSASKDAIFSFDEIFWSCETTIDHQLGVISSAQLPPQATQQDVFESIGSKTIASVVTGYNGCIFAYGQTGSGKSHSIIGSDSDPGLSPRILAALFDSLEEVKKKDPYMAYTVEMAVIEIYNEKPSDLLSASTFAALKPANSDANSSTNNLPPHKRTFSTDSGFAMNPSNTFARRGSFSESALASELELALSSTCTEPLLESTPTRTRRGSTSSMGGEHPEDRPPGMGDRRSSICSVSSDHDNPLFSFGKAVSSPVPEVSEAPTPDGSRGDASSIPDEEVTSTTLKRRSTRTRTTTVVTVESPTHQEPPKTEVLRVRQHPQHGVFLSGLRREVIDCDDTARVRLHRALDHRSVASTKMNEQSSRSHAMIQLVIQQESRLRGTSKSSCLNIIDLAGSERIKLSGVTGSNLTEAKNINLSLSTLRRVIDIMLENQGRPASNQLKPPYRDALLTHLLSDSLGGNSKTTMLATVSPHKDYIEDTLSTLRYASRARAIICKVRVNKTMVQTTMTEVQGEVDSLKKQLTIQEESETATVVLPQLRQVNNKKKHVNGMVEKINMKKEATKEQLKAQVDAQNAVIEEATAELRRREELDAQAKRAAEETLALIEEMKRQKEQLDQNVEDIKELEAQIEVEQTVIDDIFIADPDFEEKFANRRTLQRKIWRHHFINAAREVKEQEETAIVDAQRKILNDRKAILDEKDAKFDTEIEFFEDAKTIRKMQTRINEVALDQVEAYDMQQEINTLTLAVAHAVGEKKNAQSEIGRMFAKETVEKDNFQVGCQLSDAVLVELVRLQEKLEARDAPLDQEEAEIKQAIREADEQYASIVAPAEDEVLELEEAGKELASQILQVNPTLPVVELEAADAEQQLARTELECRDAEAKLAKEEAKLARVAAEMAILKADYDELAISTAANVAKATSTGGPAGAHQISSLAEGRDERPSLPNICKQPFPRRSTSVTSVEEQQQQSQHHTPRAGGTTTPSRSGSVQKKPTWSASTRTQRSVSPFERVTVSAGGSRPSPSHQHRDFSPMINKAPNSVSKKEGKSTSRSVGGGGGVATLEVGKPIPMFLSGTPPLQRKRPDQSTGGGSQSPLPMQPLKE